MAKYEMSEALCALPGGAIECRRKSLAVPLVILLTGVICFVINYFVLGALDMPNLKSALVLFGAVFILVGGAMAFTRLAGHSTAPYHTKDHCFLHREELKFNKEHKATVMELLNKGDFATLRKIPSDGISAFMVVIYTSPKSGLTAAQAFEYVELELRPASELKIVE